MSLTGHTHMTHIVCRIRHGIVTPWPWWKIDKNLACDPPSGRVLASSKVGLGPLSIEMYHGE